MRNAKRLLVIMIFVLGSIIFMQLRDINNMQTTKKQTIFSFQRGKSLICQVSLGGRASILINKKNDELINIAYCTLIEDRA